MEKENSKLPSIKDVPESSWKKLSERRTYFGHQSVGFNIVDGLKDVMKENPQIRLNVVETNNPEDFNAPFFAHSTLGKNTEPLSKIDAFANYMERGIGDKVDIAFFKFCYVDVTVMKDVDKVFTHYKNTMSRLKKTYPKTAFVHVTVPVTSIQSGIKAWIKKIIGRPIGGYEDNIKRNRFNKMLRKEYGGKDAIFDLAKIESTFPDGRRASFTKDGKAYYAMVPHYTHDGGHLNKLGRKIAAEQLLVLMANL